MIETDYRGAREAIDAGGDVVVDLHAPWCGYCKRTRPHLDRIETERPDVGFVAVDTDEDPDAYSGFKVKTLPAIILFRDGAEVSRHESGDHAALTAWLDANARRAGA